MIFDDFYHFIIDISKLFFMLDLILIILIKSDSKHLSQTLRLKGVLISRSITQNFSNSLIWVASSNFDLYCKGSTITYMSDEKTGFLKFEFSVIM